MSGVKRFFAYLFVILAIFVAIVIICFAILFFSPGTEILGYEYIRMENQIEEKFTPTDLSGNEVIAFKFETNNPNVTVKPNTQGEDLQILYSQQVSGITKTISADYSFKADYKQESYDENIQDCKSLVVTLTEPSGFTVKSNSSITILLPVRQYEVVFIKSQYGNVTYNAKEADKDNTTTYVIDSTSLYLQTGEHGEINVNTQSDEIPVPQIDNYNFTTVNGSVIFNSANELVSNKIVFNTNSGRFSFTNQNNDALISLKNGFVVNASGEPSINVNVLDGNLDVDCQKGDFNFNTIGSPVNSCEVLLSSNNSTFNFNHIYGYVSLLDVGDNVSNRITISCLENRQTNSSTFQVGSGYVNIGELIGTTSFSSTTGKISANKIDVNSSVYAYSDTGAISLNYVESNSPNNQTLTCIYVQDAPINLQNISGKISVNVLAESSNNSVNVSFCAISTQQRQTYENTINAKNQVVNITLNGIVEHLSSRLFTTKDAEFNFAPGERINPTDLDYEDGEEYAQYVSQYRIGYEKPTVSAAFEGYGRLCVSSTATIKVNLNIN